MSQCQPPVGSTPVQLRPTDVVTCFLLRFDQRDERGEPLLLIVQRSQRVGSYRERWAGISGFIEPGVTPEEQAYTEIREETGLERQQVRLLRRGAVVEHLDPQLGRHWSIHPFLFEVLTPEAIHTDWEALTMRWIRPTELEHYQTVPRLKEAYEAALQGESVL